MGSRKLEQVHDTGPTGLDDGGDTSSGVIKFIPGQVATGNVPLFEPAPGRVWSTFPHLLKVLGYMLLFTSFVTLYMAAAAWENVSSGNWGLNPNRFDLDYYFAAIICSGCTVMCLSLIHI